VKLINASFIFRWRGFNGALLRAQHNKVISERMLLEHWHGLQRFEKIGRNGKN